ncbi:MAG: hypothetical protein ACR5K4_04285 [Sodalis sp. (in: enterobacteria)]
MRGDSNIDITLLVLAVISIIKVVLAVVVGDKGHTRPPKYRINIEQRTLTPLGL